MGMGTPKRKRVLVPQRHLVLWGCKKDEQTQTEPKPREMRWKPGLAAGSAAPAPQLGHGPPSVSSHLGVDFTMRMTIYCSCLGNKYMEIKQKGVVCI